jgi:hypothetical protein
LKLVSYVKGKTKGEGVGEHCVQEDICTKDEQSKTDEETSE